MKLSTFLSEITEFQENEGEGVILVQFPISSSLERKREQVSIATVSLQAGGPSLLPHFKTGHQLIPKIVRKQFSLAIVMLPGWKNIFTTFYDWTLP